VFQRVFDLTDSGRLEGGFDRSDQIEVTRVEEVKLVCHWDKELASRLCPIACHSARVPHSQ